jgi:hypothetical protein
MRRIILAGLATLAMAIPALAQQSAPQEQRQSQDPAMQRPMPQQPDAQALPGQQMKPETEGAGTPDVRQRQGQDREVEQNIPPKGNVEGGSGK